jgi:tetratricopeptide (TPR) repeat protein
MGRGVGVDTDAERFYTVAQLGRILKIPVPRIRGWVRRGLIRPARTERRLEYFDFRQMAELKRLHELTQTGLAEPTGQLRLDLGVRGQSGASPERPALRVIEGFRDRPVVPAADAFERAVELEEEDDLEGAVLAYEQALLDFGPDAEIAFNLGNALYALGRLDEAIDRFEMAVEIDAEYVEAWNNLGGAYADAGRWNEAIRSAQRALLLAPEWADPHYNLAEAYAASGRYGDARLHANRYLQQDPSSPWAERLRRDLGIR